MDAAVLFLAGMRKDLLFLSSLKHLIIPVLRREGGLPAPPGGSVGISPQEELCLWELGCSCSSSSISFS